MSTNTNTRTTAPRGAKAEAKAKAAAKALTEAAANLSAEPTEAERVHAMLTPTAGRTVAEYLADANAAVKYLTATEADAFSAKVMARQAIGAEMYAAYRARLTEADANAEIKAAHAVTFTALAAAIFPAGKSTRPEYEALPAAKRPIARSWSALAEDWALYVNTAGDAWRAAYDLARGEAEPTVRDYLAFSRRANAAEAEANTPEGESPQAKGARTKAVTKAAAEAEATRQAEAKAKAKADAEAKADADAKAKAADALARVGHVLGHPSANVVPGVDLTNATLAALSLPTLRDLTATLAAFTAHREAEATKAAADAKAAAKAAPKVADTVADGQAKAEAIVAAHDTAADVEALGASAEANADDTAAIVAAVMAALAAAKATA
jgi:hypothetical protein